MKKTLLSLVATFSLATPAFAADTHVAWQGFFTVTGTTAACAGLGGTSVGDTNVSIYRPGFSTTDHSSMNIIFTRAAMNVWNADETVNPQMRGSGNATVNAMNSKAKLFKYSTTYSNIVTTPSTIFNGTTYLAITGTLNNMWNVSGCNVTFKASYSKE